MARILERPTIMQELHGSSCFRLFCELVLCCDDITIERLNYILLAADRFCVIFILFCILRAAKSIRAGT